MPFFPGNLAGDVTGRQQHQVAVLLQILEQFVRAGAIATADANNSHWISGPCRRATHPAGPDG